MRIGLIFNPTAQGDKARYLRRQLDEIVGECILLPTMRPGHAEDLAAQAVADGLEMLVAAGGDGTVHEVANGLARDADVLARTALGILPLGTVNVLARELGIPLDFEAAWRVIQRGHIREIDLPWMELQREGKTQRRCFPALGGAGMDGRACELVNWETKKRSGQFAYLTAGYRAAMEPLPSMRVVADGRVFDSAELIKLGNGPFYGGPFEVFPAARLDDGKVDAIIAERIQKWRTPEYLWGVLTGNLPSLAGVHYVQAASIELTPANGNRVVVQLDGDATGELPAKINVAPASLRMVAPAPVF